MSSAAPAILVRDLRKRYGDHRGRARHRLRGRAAARCSACSAPTARARRRPSRSSRATATRTSGDRLRARPRPAQRSRELRERIGIVLQSSGIYRHIARARGDRATGPASTRARATSTRCSRSPASRRRPTRARARSRGGQLRRLDFALALVGDPELIFLDEPTTGFDPEARRAAWDVVRSLQELGKTVLLTTHYLDEAQALADRVAIVKDGRSSPRARRAELGAGARALPRHLARRGRRAARARDRRPDRAAARAHERGARARRAAARTCRSRGRRSRTSTWS